MSKQTLKYVGKGRPIHDAVLKVTGEKKYTADLKFPRMLYGKILYSKIAHGIIKNIDVSQAEAMIGVKAVATCKNSSRVSYNSAMRFYDHELPENERVFDEKVRYVGDRVAAVAAVDLETAEKALRLIKVEYEELPAVFDPEEALKDDSPAVHPGGNKVAEIQLEAGNLQQGFTEADRIFEDRYTMPAIHHGAIELHAAIADYDSSGKLTVLSPNQNTFAFRSILSKIFAIPMHKVRVIRPAIGGAFGGKLEATIEPVAAQLAILTGRPVKIELNRREVIASTRTRHGAVVYMKTGVMKDGTITAQNFRVLTNTGAYAGSAINVVAAMSHKVFKLYKTRNIRYTGIPVYTNTPVAGAMRGYGSPQAFYAQQVQLQTIADTLEMDMIDLQRKNLVEPDARDPLFSKPMGNPRPLDCAAKGADRFGWTKRMASQQTSVKKGRLRRGVGMAMGLHGNGLFGAHRDFTCLTLKLNEDGTALLSSGTHDMGNGSITVQAQVIGEILGIDPDSITVNETDTETVPYNLGDYASRGTWVGGNAARKAALGVKMQLLEEAAKLLNTPPERLSLEEGMIIYPEHPETKATLSEIVLFAHRESQKEIITSETYASTAGPASYGAHFAEVEVDTKTGEVKVFDYLAIHDVGKAINPLSLEGQIEGAIQMGIGYALTEGLVLDASGKVTNNSLKKYKMLRSVDMPKLEVMFIEEGEEPGPFGGKSIGECSTVASAPAVVNAVSNALGGIPFYDFPLWPERILKALKEQ